MKESDLLEEDFPLPQKEEKTEELQDDIENLNLNEYLKAKDIDVSEGAGIQNKVSLKEREQKKDPEKKPGLRMIARNKVDEMKPEDFLLHKDAFSLSDKRVRKEKIKRFLLDRALIRYNYCPDNEYGKDREVYYQDYLEKNEIAQQLIDDLAHLPKGSLVLGNLKDDRAMKICFDILEKDIEAPSDEKRAQIAEEFYNDPETKLDYFKKKRFFGEVHNPSCTVGQLQDVCKNKLKEAKENPFPIDIKHATQAADLIFAQMLSQSRANVARGFFGKGRDEKICPPQKWLKDGEFFQPVPTVRNRNDHTLKYYNDKIADMREKMEYDVIFQRLIKEGGSSKDFVERYRREMKARVTRSAGDTIAAAGDPAVEKEPFKLSDKERQFFKDMYENMDAYNNHEVRKGVNETMMKALKNVNDKADAGTLTVGDMRKLNYASAHYYMTRKGTFMEPVTQTGKDRLYASGEIHQKAKSILEAFNARLERENPAKNQHVRKP